MESIVSAIDAPTLIVGEATHVRIPFAVTLITLYASYVGRVVFFGVSANMGRSWKSVRQPPTEEAGKE